MTAATTLAGAALQNVHRRRPSRFRRPGTFRPPGNFLYRGGNLHRMRLPGRCPDRSGPRPELAATAPETARCSLQHGVPRRCLCPTSHCRRRILWSSAAWACRIPGSRSCSAGRCPFIPEGFADRGYRSDGSLVPRSEPDAFIHDPAEAVRQVEWSLRKRAVRTICVHGDNPQALAFVRALRSALTAAGHRLVAFHTP